MTVRVVKPTTDPRRQVTLFLAGAIDNGAAVDWQADMERRIEEKFGDSETIDVVVYNPRRNNWNPDPSVKELSDQINWELDRLNEADIVVMVFPDDSKAPISFLELGMLLERKSPNELFVSCTRKFYRYDNVLLTCARYNVPVYSNFDEYCDSVLRQIYYRGRG